MEEPKNNVRRDGIASDAELKEKYGKVYRIGMTVAEDDETEVELVYRFKRPSIASYDRYVKTLAQIGASRASKNIKLDAVVEEEPGRPREGGGG